MRVDRRWYWLGGALVVAGAVLVAGVPFGTLLTIAALLACPAAMYFGMDGGTPGGIPSRRRSGASAGIRTDERGDGSLGVASTGRPVGDP